jgi:tetratricopeptide (TPR) repeat protein
MNTDLAQEAISEALKGNWKKALELNQLHLKKTPDDVDALNRIARAYAELGSLEKAKSVCQKALSLDPFNSIAAKSLEKWKSIKKSNHGNSNNGAQASFQIRPSNPQTFLEEPGRTKIVTLLYLGGPQILAKLDAADEVQLDTHSHRVSIMTLDNKYIGRLPDDLSAKLRNLVKGGNEYRVFIKSIMPHEVKVFIREIKRAKKFADVASFQGEKIDYVSFTPPELVHKKQEILEDIAGEDE